MKNWTAVMLVVALCATALLSSLTTVLVLSSAFLPVDDWLAAAAGAWKTHAVRRRWRHTRRRLWRRLDAALRGDAPAYQWREAVLAREDDVVADEFAFEEDDMDDEDDDCLGMLNDWKHGPICLISR